MTIHQVARTYATAPDLVREWPWRDVVRAQALERAEAEAQEAVRKHNEALNGR